VVAYRIRDGVLSRRESEATRDLSVLDNLWRVSSSDATDLAGATPAVALQSETRAMNTRLWTSSGGWRSTDSSASSGTAPDSTAVAPTGLEVTLLLGQSESGMVKVMLLGAM
jgi:general secretion pathway protein J